METKLFNFCHTNVNEVDRNDYFGGTWMSRVDPGELRDRKCVYKEVEYEYRLSKLVPSPRVRPDIRLLCFCFFSGSTTVFETYRIRVGENPKEWICF